jgi:TetR/AcrR family transcriptional regulator of autoinduction and epiphytic fitness
MKPKRQYDSTRRKAQARQTRREIIEAARRLFTERGYTGATIEAIAQEADVAVETIYAAFGNKRALFSRLVDVSVGGDDEPILLLQRPGPQAVQKEHDQRTQVRMFAHQMSEIMSRMAPIFDVMHTAAKTEPDIADLRSSLLQQRLHGIQVFISALASNGPLQKELTEAQAAETTWVISSGEVFSLLTQYLGWPDEQYEAWLEDSLSRLLLP